MFKRQNGITSNTLQTYCVYMCMCTYTWMDGWTSTAKCTSM